VHPRPRPRAHDTSLLEAAAALGEILSLLARRAPGPVAHALSREVALIVFPRNGQPIPFRIQFGAPDRVVVAPGVVDQPRTRIVCTRQALKRWVRGDLDLKTAREDRMFFVEGDPAPFRALAAAMDTHEKTVVRPPAARMSVAAAMSARFSPPA
jgi:hypothetical protein